MDWKIKSQKIVEMKIPTVAELWLKKQKAISTTSNFMLVLTVKKSEWVKNWKLMWNQKINH